MALQSPQHPWAARMVGVAPELSRAPAGKVGMIRLVPTSPSALLLSSPRKPWQQGTAFHL